MRMKKIAAIVLAGCLVVSTFAACGSGNVSSAVGNSGSAGAAIGGEISGEVAADAGLHNLDDGVLDIGSINSWESLTPIRSNASNNAPWAYQIYETLARLNYEKEYVPLVAKSWSAEEDGVTFNIEIYDYVTDSAGNHITADDIVWMIETSKEAALKPAFSKVASVEKTGDYTLKVVMTQDMVGAFEAILTNTFAVSKAAFEASKDEFATEVVTTSPYIVTEFTPSSTITLEKRDDYWQKEELIPENARANVDKITYHVVKEASQAGIAMETGDLDGFVQLDPNTANQFVGNNNYTMVATPYINGYQMYFSGADERNIANDLALRQAICYAIDVEGLVAGVFSGYGVKMHDPIANTSVGYLSKWDSEEYYDYNPEKAKELLAQSNYNGEELLLLSGSNSTTQRICQMIQGYLQAVGINVKLNLADTALYTAIRLDGTQYDMTVHTVGGDSLPDHWATRYDMNSYKTGDATSRHDEVLAEMLYSTWTQDGFTEENIDAVHNYLKDNMYAFGMVQPNNIDIWRSDIGMTDVIRTCKGSVDFASSAYNG